jgi:aminoglycoside phosphotransferase (APT) family kinase protein
MDGQPALDLDVYQRWRKSCFLPKADLPLADWVLRSEGITLLADATIAQACSQLLHQPVTVTPLAEGTAHRLWRVHCASGETLICRANALYRWFRDYPLWLDAYVSDRLGHFDVPVLATRAIDLSRQYCPTDLIVLDEARGTSLRAFDDDDERLRPLLYQLGSVLARLHRVDIDHGYGLIDLKALFKSAGQLSGSHSTWEEYLRLNLDAHVEACLVEGAITPDEAKRICWLFDDCGDLFAHVRPALLHGDLGNHNVFAADGKITALIDWEDALAGDPVYEIAFWATFHPERRHDAFMDGYRSEAALPVDFEARFWLYFVRIALAKTVLRRRFGLKDRPGREPAALRIRKGLHRLEATLVGRMQSSR